MVFPGYKPPKKNAPKGVAEPSDADLTVKPRPEPVAGGASKPKGQLGYGILIVLVALFKAPFGTKLQTAKDTREVPNALTQFRMILTPLLILFLFLGLVNPVFWWVTLVIWVLGCLSDFYDGRWSRRWKHISDFGKYWDPVADKAFTIPALLVLAVLKMMPFALLMTATTYFVAYICWWVIFTFREWRVTSLRNKFKVKYPDRSVAADNTGKYKTASVMVGGATVILEAALGLNGVARLIADIVNLLLLGTATAFSMYSWLFIYEREYKIEKEEDGA